MENNFDVGAIPEPVAIIGMSCRLPGSSSEPSQLWDLLTKGKSAWSEVPKDRFNMHAFHDPSNPTGSTTNTKGGHFLDQDLAAFDADFFGMSPVELKALDPQQRLLMELAFESFENAGVSMKQLWGSNTGVYVAHWSPDWNAMLARDHDFLPLYHTVGTGAAILSNRLSYFFNLTGPSFTVDSGCSGSLVALHNAVQSLRSGETDLSFVGGVNLLLDPQQFTSQSKLGFFSVDGRCYTFDSRANGCGRAEGCCGVVLKRLSAALCDHDPIRAIIRNTTVNSDGRTSGITVPDQLAQMAAIKKTYSIAGLHHGPDFVEAHGTGTPVGDPIEVKAIAGALAALPWPVHGPVPVGSIKANIGHPESAAGLASLVKAVLMLENQKVPPQVNFETPNPNIPFKELGLYVPTSLKDKPLRRISINSFGYGGTNAHVILDRAQAVVPHKNDIATFLEDTSIMDEQQRPARKRLFIISATNQEAFKSVAQSLIDYIHQRCHVVDVDSWFIRRF